MPGGELSQEGDANTELFSEMVQEVGWLQRGPQNSNVECAVCKRSKNGIPKKHGIDTLFTFDCPYQKRTRGIVVDGKRFQMSSVSKTTIKEWLTKTLNVTRHMEGSISFFREELDIPDDTVIDSGAIAWDCHVGWDMQKWKAMVSDVVFSSIDNPAISVFIFNTHTLNKLATIVLLSRQYSKVEYLYNPEKLVDWFSVLTPELLLSDIIGFRYKKDKESQWEHAILYFGATKTRDIKFIIAYIIYAQLSPLCGLDVFIPCKQSELVRYQSFLNAELQTRSSHKLQLQCKQLSMVKYNS